jgi:ATP-dependent DNA helicase RecQ
MSTPVESPLEAFLPQFGLKSFRPGQEDVIASVLSGRDCLCVMPTGGGKSLCYQLPAVVLQGLTLVVSPLIALMKDQVDQLTALKLPVTFINSTLPLAEQYERLDRMAAGEYRLVYVVPERFRSKRFLEAVQSARLSLLAVDEAHCISEWGHDFRPDYARLGHFRRLLGNPTTIALTATATDKVRRDIVEQLRLREPKTFITGFARPNLFYEVQMPRSERSRAEMLIRFLKKTPGSGIVYATTRKKTEEVAQLIAAEVGRPSTAYHAGLLPDQRKMAQEAFMSGRVDIVAATTAFGMGIDKSDVRFVVHYNLPGTLEGYYQEAGRAGRDGKPSHCLLLFNAADRHIQEYFIASAYPARENIQRVYDYLRMLDDDPIQLTQEDIRERLGLRIGSDGVGTCEQILESAGVLERLVASQNQASVRLDSDLPTLVDLLPKQAKVRRQVLRAIEKIVGDRRNELVQFRPAELARMAELDPTSLATALRELNSLDVFTYIPPFRGRAIRMLRRDESFDQLEIDFEELDRLKAAEIEKLNRVIRFALSTHCRQQEILRYFGDPNKGSCGHCDNCDRQGHHVAAASAAAPTPAGMHEKVRTTLRMILSGVARTQARFRCGKTLIAQMLCGSGSARMEKLGMTRLSTFGLLKNLKQPDVVMLIDSLVATGHLEQIDLEPNRPVLQLTDLGTELMKGTDQSPIDVPIPAELLAELTGERPDPKQPAAKKPAAAPIEPEELPPADSGLLVALRRWCGQTAAQSGVPPHYILTKATLEELARRRPDTAEALLQVKGIGPGKLARYGDELLALLTGREIESPEGSGDVAVPADPVPEEPAEAYPSDFHDYDPTYDEPFSFEPDPFDEVPPELPDDERAPGDSHPAAPTLEEARPAARPPETTTPAVSSPPPASPTPVVRPTHYWTWRLFSMGFTAEECQSIRGVPRDVILDHLLRAADEGLSVQAAWCLAPHLLTALESLVDSAHPAQIRPLLDKLPAGTRYEEVELYLKTRR